MLDDEVKVVVTYQGSVAVRGVGYMLKKGDGVAAFYLDTKERSWPAGSSSHTNHFSADGNFTHSEEFPSIFLISSDEDEEWTEIGFPEYVGWMVHSVSGGKVLSVCLTKL